MVHRRLQIPAGELCGGCTQRSWTAESAQAEERLNPGRRTAGLFSPLGLPERTIRPLNELRTRSLRTAGGDDDMGGRRGRGRGRERKAGSATGAEGALSFGPPSSSLADPGTPPADLRPRGRAPTPYKREELHRRESFHPTSTSPMSGRGGGGGARRGVASRYACKENRAVEC